MFPTQQQPPDVRAGRSFWMGLAFWALVCVALVLVRGVRWEEGYERAQVLLGFTPYPEGHPHARWYWNAFSVHYYVSAAALWLTQSAAVVCGGRQLIATLAIALPIFTLTWLLARRVLQAHLAVLLSFAGAPIVFQSYMPISAWANKATSGQIGTGWAFAVLIALSAGRWRTAGLLCGLMPLIHIGQWPIIMLTLCTMAVWRGYRGDTKASRSLVIGAATGLACCALFAVVQRPFLLPDPVEGAYYSEKDSRAIWADYVTHEDMHRAITRPPRFGPLGNSIMALTAFLILALPMALRAVRSPSGQCAWLVIYIHGLLCASAFIIAQGVHRVMGTEVPAFVVTWMPNRLTIHLGLLLLCALCAWPTRRGGAFICLVAVGWLAAVPLWPSVVGDVLATRYFSGPETALFLLAGGAIVALWRGLGGAGLWRKVWGALLGLGLVALTGHYPFATATVVAGGFLTLSADHIAKVPLRRGLYVSALCVLAGIALTYIFLGEARTREQLPVSPMEASIARYLAEHSAPSDMVLTPLDEHYQMVLGRPVVATFETRQHSGYVPSIAATNEKLFADLYGVKDGHWYDWVLWQRRTTEEWIALGHAYGFRYVISKDFHPLHLPVRLSGDGLVLYEVPGIKPTELRRDDALFTPEQTR